MFTKNKDKNTPQNTASNPDANAPMAPAQSPAENGAAAPVAQPAPATEPAKVAEPAAPSAEAVELAALKDRCARLLADYDNFRKRQNRDREDLIRRANEELLGDLLPVVDHLELALAKSAAPADPFVVGIKLVYDQLVALLIRYGLTPLDTKGEPFDPTYHEALSQMSSATVPAHMIIDQFRRGWLLAGRLLRPAQVIVSSGAPDPEQADAENASVSD